MPVTQDNASLKGDLARLFARDRLVLQDPYPLYKRLREAAAVFAYDANTVIVSRYAEVNTVYRDNARFPSPKDLDNKFEGRYSLLSPSELELHERWMSFERTRMSRLNGEEHRRVRNVAQRAFTPTRLEGLQVSIARITKRLLDELEEEDEPDFMHLAYRLPLLVILDMMGIPHEDAPMLKRWCDAIAKPGGENPLRPEAVRQAYAAAVEFRGYIRELVRVQRRLESTTTLVGSMLDASTDDRLREDELISMYVLLLFAGHETTTSMFANGILALMQYRDQWEALCADASLIPNAVEEMLRYDAPFHFVTKTTDKDQNVADVAIPAGTMVLVGIAAANRDPVVFANPDKFDITRQPNDHLSFGHGAHFCLGAALARIEGHIGLGALVKRYPAMRLASGIEGIAYIDNFLIRCPTSMPVDLAVPPDRRRQGRATTFSEGND